MLDGVWIAINNNGFKSNYWSLFFFLVLEFEHRTLHFLGRHSTVWVTTLALFSLIIFETGSHFLPMQIQTKIFLFYASPLPAGMTKHMPLSLALFSWDGGLLNCFFAQVGLKLCSSQFQPPICWNDSLMPLYPDIGWDGILANFWPKADVKPQTWFQSPK
jgi:hypothetical protein